MRISTKPSANMKPFDWFAARLEPEQVKSDVPGSRDWMVRCPVCSSEDNLHLEERNGSVLVHCFSPGCEGGGRNGYRAVVNALEADEGVEQDTESDDSSADDAPATRVPVIRRRRTRDEVTPSGEQVTGDPMAWYSEYCGVSAEDIRSLGVEVTADGWLAHTWPHTSVTKDRKPGSGDRRWSPKGGAQPRLWPAPPDQMEPWVWLAEGETDVIVLRMAYGLEAYTAGSASQPPDATELKALRERGVTHVVVAYDADKAGRQAASSVAEACEEAGLIWVRARLDDPLLNRWKDWRDRWKSGIAEPPEVDDEPLNMAAISSIVEEEQTELLLGRIHPQDHTILFGTGGTGKGVIAAWWAAQLAEEGRIVLVVDYERHKDEWSRRIRTFACPATEWHDTKENPHRDPKGITDRVHVFQPDEVIWDAMGDIDRAVRETGADIVIVDSVTFAVAGSGLKVEDSDTATRYFAACQKLGLPFISIAHVTKADADPAYPFGSVFWHNGARVTVGVVQKGKDDEPRKIEVKKFNQGKKKAITEIDWTWVNSSLPHGGLTEEDASMKLEDRILVILRENGGMASVAELEATLKTQPEGMPTAKNAVPKVMQTLSKKFYVRTQPGKKWGLTKQGSDHADKFLMEEGGDEA